MGYLFCCVQHAFSGAVTGGGNIETAATAQSQSPGQTTDQQSSGEHQTPEKQNKENEFFRGIKTERLTGFVYSLSCFLFVGGAALMKSNAQHCHCGTESILKFCLFPCPLILALPRSIRALPTFCRVRVSRGNVTRAYLLIILTQAIQHTPLYPLNV